MGGEKGFHILQDKTMWVVGNGDQTRMGADVWVSGIAAGFP